MSIKVTIMPLDIDPESKPNTLVFDKEEITIGRLPSNDIVLNRPEISGIHARVRIEQGIAGDSSKLYITDLGSANGTLVEKNPLRARVEVAMMPNERIFIGNYVIKPALLEVESSVNIESGEEDRSNNDTAEIRRNYLSDALKEYEQGKLNLNRSKEIEDRIDRFTEERAVANSSAPTSNFLNTIIDDSGKRARVNTEPASLSLNAMFGAEKRVQESVTPYGGVFKNLAGNEDNNEDAPVKAGVEDFRVPVRSYEDTKPNVSSFFKVDSDKPSNHASNEGASVEEVKNPIARAFTARKTAALSPSDVIDSLKIKVKVESSDIHAFNFSAAAYTNIFGRVVHKGVPLAGVKISAGQLGEIITDDSGAFDFPKVLEGTPYQITLEKDKFVFEPKEFRGSTTLSSKEMHTEATELFSISGIINHNGQPLAGVTVDGGVLGKVITSSDGSYKFENVPEGQEYNLTLSKEGYAFVK